MLNESVTNAQFLPSFIFQKVGTGQFLASFC